MQPLIIGIAGPSGAGKSSCCRVIENALKGVTRFKLDDFFKDEADVPKLGEATQWDEPEALKWDQLLRAVSDLRAGQEIFVPDYSRHENKQIGEKLIRPSEIILVDGFMSLYHPELRELLDLKLFFDLSEESQLIRRRQRQPGVQEDYLYNVMLPAARQYIMPSKVFADFIIDAEQPEPIVAQTCLGIITNKLL